MNNGNRKGVSLIKYTPEVKKEADIIIVRSFIADDVDIDNPLWRSQKMCDFLDIFYKQLSDLKGNDGSIDYPHEILDPRTEPIVNHNSLYDQSMVVFSGKIKGGKELN
jgi:hypothetical protein